MISLSDLRNMDQAQLSSLYHAMQVDRELFAKIVFQHIVGSSVPEYQKHMYKMLGSELENLCVVAFRGSAKSTIGHTFDTAHDICYASEPFTLFISESVDQAVADLVGVQEELEHNELLRAMYGNLVGSVWNREFMETANGCFVQCRGTMSKIRGLKWKNSRPTKIKLDDIESEHNSNTEYQRKQLSNWVFTNVLRAGMPGLTKYQFFGTIVHPKSFLALAENMDMFKPPHGNYYKVSVEENGVPAWKSRYPMHWILQERAKYLGAGKLSLFLQEMYHVPHTDSKLAFNTSMMNLIAGQFYTNEYNIPFIAQGQSKIPLYVFAGVDPADTESDDADATNVCVIGVMPSSSPAEMLKVVILHSEQFRLAPSKSVERINSILQRYKPRITTFETQGGRVAYKDLLQLEMRKSGTMLPIKEFKTNQGKTNKWLNGLEAFVNTGRIHYLPDAHGINDIKAQMEEFNSEVHEHDDLIDGLFLALQSAYSPANFDVDAAIRRIRERRESNKKQKKAVNWYTA